MGTPRPAHFALHHVMNLSSSTVPLADAKWHLLFSKCELFFHVSCILFSSTIWLVGVVSNILHPISMFTSGQICLCIEFPELCRCLPHKLVGKESEWTTPFVGGDHEWLIDKGAGGRNIDARTRFFYLATANTPAMIMKMVGVGSQYILAFRDEKHEYLDGSKCYSLTLPANVPVKDFWSLVLYDAQHRSMLQTPQIAPGRNSVRHPDMKFNNDGSITLWFGPKAPSGKESNWLQTTPGKTWFVCLRLYGPLESWFNHTWRPSEIKEEEADRKRKAPP